MKISCLHQSFNADLIHDLFEKPSDPNAILKEYCTELQAWACGLRMYFTGPASVEAKMAQDNGLDSIQDALDQENALQSLPLKIIAETHITAPIPIKTPQIASRAAKLPKKRLDRETFTGELANGKLNLNRADIAKALSQFEDCKVEVVIERVRNLKSKNQLGFLFGAILPLISKHTGHDIEYLYRYVFLPMFGPKEIVQWKGKEIISVKRLSKMTSEEASEFIQRIIVEANEMGIITPVADKDWAWREMPELIS